MQYRNDAIETIRGEPASVLLEKFKKTPQIIVCSFWKLKLFPITNSTKYNNCIYLKGQKKDVPEKNLSRQTVRQCVKGFSSFDMVCSDKIIT